MMSYPVASSDLIPRFLQEFVVVHGFVMLSIFNFVFHCIRIAISNTFLSLMFQHFLLVIVIMPSVSQCLKVRPIQTDSTLANKSTNIDKMSSILKQHIKGMIFIIHDLMDCSLYQNKIIMLLTCINNIEQLDKNMFICELYYRRK